jgi:hypothetical protein
LLINSEGVTDRWLGFIPIREILGIEMYTIVEKKNRFHGLKFWVSNPGNYLKGFLNFFSFIDIYRLHKKHTLHIPLILCKLDAVELFSVLIEERSKLTQPFIVGWGGGIDEKLKVIQALSVFSEMKNRTDLENQNYTRLSRLSNAMNGNWRWHDSLDLCEKKIEIKELELRFSESIMYKTISKNEIGINTVADKPSSDEINIGINKQFSENDRARLSALYGEVAAASSNHVQKTRFVLGFGVLLVAIIIIAIKFF